MTKVEALIEEARRLPASDRVRLLAEVGRSLDGDKSTETPLASYAPLLALAGSAASEFRDVSTEKYRHLASAIAPEPQEE
jgi:hypothetical protein